MHGGRFAWFAAVCLATAWSGLVGHRPDAFAGDTSAGDERGDVVVVGVPPTRAAAIAARAAATRRDIAARLLGAEEPRRWSPPCAIHVHRDRVAFARAVGGAPVAAGGATSIEFVGDTVSLRRIDLLDAADGGVPPALDHELVHVVLADRFPDAPPPRWADEGLATLFDDPEKQWGHDADFRAAAARGQSWRIADLVALDLDPADAARQRVFYGQSAALVRWLLTRRDGPTFLRFLDDAAEQGTERALSANYAIDSLEALERAWLAEAAAPLASR